MLLVGRGGNFFLRDQAQALHIRLVSPMDVRVRRVMEHRWLREKQARQLITQSDAQRRSFAESYFGADWANPLEYDITINSGRQGPTAVDLVAFLAETRWAKGLDSSRVDLEGDARAVEG